jgi:hypothetical protein
VGNIFKLNGNSIYLEIIGLKYHQILLNGPVQLHTKMNVTITIWTVLNTAEPLIILGLLTFLPFSSLIFLSHNLYPFLEMQSFQMTLLVHLLKM